MRGTLLRIEKSREKFSPSEQRVANYVLEHAENVVGLPVAELAQYSGSNRAAVVRFCKRMGFEGYRDFTLALAAELAVEQNKGKREATDIQPGDSVENIMQSICANSIQSIQDSCTLLRLSDVQAASDLLIKAKKIDFYGIGASQLAAQDAQYKFMRINKNCTAYPDGHLQLTSASLLSETDVAVAISWSGETKDVVEAASMAKSKGAAVITITQYGKNRLSQCGDIAFQLTSPETAIRIGAMSSRIAQLTLIDILFSCVVSKEPQNIDRYLKQTRPVGKKKRYQK